MQDRTAELTELARRVDEKTFAKRVPGLFLILSTASGEVLQNIRSTVRVERTGSTPAPEPRSFVVVEVARRPSSPFEDLVSIGRTDANDLVLPHPTVSKLHATFTQDEAGTWHLVDQGSTNGTWVDGVRLAAQKPHALRGDDMVAFGEFHAALKNGRALWRFLELARRSA